MARCGRRTPCANGPSTKRGLQSAFSKHLPLHGGTWWAPEYLRRGQLHDRVPIPGAVDGRARVMAFGSPQPRELGPDHDGHVVDPRDKTGLFSWLTAKYGLLAELNEELGRSRTHAESQATATKYEGLLVRSGHRGLSRRCAALRSASLTIEEEEARARRGPVYGHERAASEALANLGLALRVRGQCHRRPSRRASECVWVCECGSWVYV